MRKYRENNVLKAAYHNLRGNAKHRGKEFSLTLEEFEEFAIRTNYIGQKGKSKFGYTIDRIDQNEGYHAWNIQVLTNSENVKKYFDYTYNNGQMEFSFRPATVQQLEGVPF